MSIRYEKPETYGVKDMFIWWCKAKIKHKRHMRIVGERSNSVPTRLISKNSDELNWLREHVLVLYEQVEKLQIADKKKSYFTKDTEEIYRKNREIYEANDRIKHLEQVDGKTEQVVITQKTFQDVIKLYNQKVIDRLVNNAAVVNMKSNMGFLYIQRVERGISPDGSDKSLKMPNWKESFKAKEELIAQGITPKDQNNPDGAEWIIYFDDEYFVRFAWSRRNGACRVRNHGFYKFIPAKGKTGARRQLSMANKKNKFLIHSYKLKSGYYINGKKTA